MKAKTTRVKLLASGEAEYQYIGFVRRPAPPTRKTGIWNVYNLKSGVVIGEIRWYARWRCFCFEPEPLTRFSPGCLEDIQAFISGIESSRKAERKAEKEKQANEH